MSGLIPLAMMASSSSTPPVYEVLNSGVFDEGVDAYMDFGFGTPTDDKKFTLSFWVKRSMIGLGAPIFTTYSSGNDRSSLEYSVAAGFRLFDVSAGSLIVDRTTGDTVDDGSQFYHITLVIDTTQSVQDDRIKIWVNETQLTFTGSSNYSLNQSSSMGKAYPHYIAVAGNALTSTTSLLISDMHFIDGQGLLPSDFAERDAITNQWNPIEYAGTYGNNGFLLEFKNGANLGLDSSTNGNTFTNSGVTQGDDTPSNNHCVLNYLKKASTSTLNRVGNGFTITTSGSGAVHSTFYLSTGKWYWEVEINPGSAGSAIGVATIDQPITNNMTGVNSYSYSYDARKFMAGVVTAYGTTYTSGDVIGIALDMDVGDIEFFKNGVSQGVADSSLAGLEVCPNAGDFTNTMGADLTFRFIESSWTESAPSNFLAINSKNLPTPDITLPLSKFATLLFDDGVGAKNIGFQPDLVWLKSRGSVKDHKLVDSVRGATKAISTSNSVAETIEATGLTSFDANGFTVGSDANYSDQSGSGMVSWSWAKSILSGVDIIKYVGTGVAGTIPHNLSAVPRFIMVKPLDPVQDFYVYHADAHDTTPAGYYLRINSTSGRFFLASIWNNIIPTTSVFSVGTSGGTNKLNDNYVAYVFADVVGFSKIGSYVGSATDAFVNCGFRPAFILIKRRDSASQWQIYDSKRSPSSPVNDTLLANTSAAESIGTIAKNIDILANGFIHNGTSSEINTSGNNYLFVAFAEHPFKYSRAN